VCGYVARAGHKKGRGNVKSEAKSIIKIVEDDHHGDEDDIMDTDPTEEEIARLDRQMEETYRTGVTPLLDAILPDADWHKAEMLELFYTEVVRRLGSDGAVDEDGFFEPVERCFQRARSEEQCIAEWRTRLS
jgi:hypothetical protein